MKYLMFQFHDGSISTKVALTAPVWGIGFQFHDGSISTPMPHERDRVRLSFQFHDGSISTNEHEIVAVAVFGFNSTMVRSARLPLATASRPQVSFQFHDGSISTSLIIFDADSFAIVSIPRWFDQHCRFNAKSPALHLCFNSTMVRSALDLL